MTKYAYAPEWEIDSYPGCCKAEVVLRLDAVYTNTRGTHIRRLRDCDDIKQGCYTSDFAMPIHILFSAVLSDMLAGDSLFTAVDRTGRMRGQDVHTGSFSTRAFVRWLDKNKLAKLSAITANGLTMWSIRINRTKCRTHVNNVNQALRGGLIK